MTIWFDMDGTIANLYGVNGWLDDLINSNTRPYDEAEPLLNFSVFARELHKLQRKNIKIGIISWLSKSGTEEYNERVTVSKLKWLKRHLPSVVWDEIHIVSYGTPKSTVANDRNGFLFDDEMNNRVEWGENSFGVENILDTLRAI